MENSTQSQFFFGREHLTGKELRKYVRDTLPEDTAQGIEYHLADCTACRDAVEVMREKGPEVFDQIAAGIDAKVRRHLAEAAQNGEAAPPQNEPPVRSLPDRWGRMTKFYPAAAAIAMLFVVGYIFFLQGPNASDRFRSDYFPQTERLTLAKLDAAPDDSPFKLALEHYGNQDYLAAREKFSEALTAQSEKADIARVYLADIDLIEGKPQAAIEGFNQFIAPDSTSDAAWDVRWFRAQAYFELEQYDRLAEELRAFERDGPPKRKKRAQEAQKDLRTLRE